MSRLPVVAIWEPLPSSHPWQLHFALLRPIGSYITPAHGSVYKLKCAPYVVYMRYVPVYLACMCVH